MKPPTSGGTGAMSGRYGEEKQAPLRLKRVVRTRKGVILEGRS